MRNNKTLYFLSITLGVISSLFIVSCKEEPDPTPTETTFTLSASDSIVFEHADTLNIQSTSVCAVDKEFAFTLSNLSTMFTPENSSVISRSNTQANFAIRFRNIQSYSAGTYPCVVTSSITNENSTPQTKTVKVIYRPNCAYNYKSYVNGKIQYIINGTITNKSVTCSYTDEGYLKIENLSNAGSIELKMDCANNIATVIPKTINGHYYTGDAQLSGTQWNIQLYSDGNFFANAAILP